MQDRHSGISASIALGVSAVALLALAGCKKEAPAAPEHQYGFAPSSENRAPPPADANDDKSEGFVAPAGVDVTAAPGVAFRYGYAFVLPDKSIASVQEQHAGACEKLGPSQCRITGMHYRLVDEDRVQADLTFKLAPALARQFGKDGIAAVERAEGKLVDAAIQGTDVGGRISASQTRSSEIEARLKETEAKLAKGGLGDSEREMLERQASDFREQLAAERQDRSAGEEELASTPMTFNYTGNTDFAFGDSPFGDAWDSTTTSFRTMFAGVLMVCGLALPWLLLLLAIIVLWRSPPVRTLRRFVRGAGTASQQVVPAAEPLSEPKA